VFLSYSRKDKVFARRLLTGLEQRQVSAWVDWHEIDLGTRFWSEIQQGIESARCFICIVTPHWLGSRVCNDELAYAVEQRKRIIPVLRRPYCADAALVPELIAALADKPYAGQARQHADLISATNYVSLLKLPGVDCAYDPVTGAVLDESCDGPDTDAQAFDPALDALVEAIHKDLDYLREQTRLLVRAKEWDRRQRHPSLTLRGTDLAAARQALVPSEHLEPPVPLVQDYVQASARHERWVRRRNLALGAAALVLMLVGLAAALRQMWLDGLRVQADSLNPMITPMPASAAAAYAINAYEVSQRQYQLCLDAGACAALPDALSQPDYPVVEVTALQAAAYCRWIGARLPTMDEWLRAVFGEADTRFPWGSEPQPQPAWINAIFEQAPDARPAGTAAVNDPAYELGKSDSGMWHTVGNVTEWTSTFSPRGCAPGADCSQPWDGQPGTLHSDLYAIGLSFLQQIPEQSAASAMRQPYPAPGDQPYRSIGFRCARAINRR
jgi:hypothetical protein